MIILATKKPQIITHKQVILEVDWLTYTHLTSNMLHVTASKGLEGRLMGLCMSAAGGDNIGDGPMKELE